MSHYFLLRSASPCSIFRDGGVVSLHPHFISCDQNTIKLKLVNLTVTVSFRLRWAEDRTCLLSNWNLLLLSQDGNLLLSVSIIETRLMVMKRWAVHQQIVHLSPVWSLQSSLHWCWPRRLTWLLQTHSRVFLKAPRSVPEASRCSAPLKIHAKYISDGSRVRLHKADWGVQEVRHREPQDCTGRSVQSGLDKQTLRKWNDRENERKTCVCIYIYVQ